MSALRVERCFAADHPAFAGHFPGQPVVPGALLLAEVLDAVCAEPALAARLGACPVIAQAKFLAPVGPGQHLSMVFDDTPRGLRFEIRRDDAVLAASGLLAAQEAA